MLGGKTLTTNSGIAVMSVDGRMRPMLDGRERLPRILVCVFKVQRSGLK